MQKFIPASKCDVCRKRKAGTPRCEACCKVNLPIIGQMLERAFS